MTALVWIDVHGTSHDWPIGKLQGIQGLGTPPVESLAHPLPGLDGDYLSASRWLARPVSIPFVLNDTEAAVRAQFRLWAKWFDPTYGPGQLVVDNPIDGPRTLNALYVGGLELTSDYEHVVVEMVRFVCDDPFFYRSGNRYLTQ